ncbi:uncharacterized protein LOC130894257 [Diorhabda carinulata]|uniref:uncharacterized protein LOC130894257 n=1 Tax=Diorhabda carinulata TaxID=1163345 RepID=UPI0025A1E206|nr:uncharacterized protein LOC130894257 [Diorhabda carinulata]
MLDDVTKNEIFSYIENLAEEMKISKYEIKFSVVPHHFVYGGGGILVSVHITGTDYDDRQLHMDLSIKMSEKTSDDDYVRTAFKREIFFHEFIVPYLVKFLQKKSPPDSFKLCIPYCCRTFTTEDREVLIFNTLQDLGYKQTVGQLAIDQNIITSVLKALATFHAVTYSAQFEESGEFLSIINKWKPDIKDVFLLSNIENNLKTGLKMTLDMLMEENRYDIRDKLLKDIQKGTLSIIEDILSNVPTETVITHGDVWLRNVFVLFEKNNPTIAKDVKIIYWHLTTLHSPVLDLGYFLYLSSSENINTNYEKYVEYYYREFAEVLVRLGTDPAKFPFLTLLHHLENYSLMPLVVALGGIPLIILYDEMKVDVEEYETMQYANLQGNVKNLIKKKLLGILELHYKYYGK